MEVARRFGVLVLEWASLALGVYVAGHFGYLTYKDVGTLAVVAIVLGLFNSFLRPFCRCAGPTKPRPAPRRPRTTPSTSDSLRRIR